MYERNMTGYFKFVRVINVTGNGEYFIVPVSLLQVGNARDD